MVNMIYSHTVHGVALVRTMMKLLLGGSNRGESNGSVFGSITEKVPTLVVLTGSFSVMLNTYPLWLKIGADSCMSIAVVCTTVPPKLSVTLTVTMGTMICSWIIRESILSEMIPLMVKTLLENDVRVRSLAS